MDMTTQVTLLMEDRQSPKFSFLRDLFKPQVFSCGPGLDGTANGLQSRVSSRNPHEDP